MTQTTAPTAPSAPRSGRRAGLPLWRIGQGAPPSGAFIALAPGAGAPLISLALPGSLKGSAREDVARRQAQDRLGAGGAALDIRPAHLGQTDGWSRVAVADRADVLRWRSALGPGAARCRGILPDYLGLPTAPGLWTIAVDGDALRLRLGPQDGFSAEADLAAAQIALALEQARATNSLPRAVLCLGALPEPVAALLADLTIASDPADLPAALTPKVLAHGEAALDFARDPRADAANVEAQVRRMIWPLVLLLAGALGWGGATAITTRLDLDAAATLEAETLASARRDLLGPGPILDLRVQVARALARRAADTPTQTLEVSALALLRAASAVLAATDTIVLAAALGRGTDGVTLEVNVADFRALDAGLAALSGAGLRAEVTRSGIEPEGGVRATLTISGVRI